MWGYYCGLWTQICSVCYGPVLELLKLTRWLFRCCWKRGKDACTPWAWTMCCPSLLSAASFHTAAPTVQYHSSQTPRSLPSSQDQRAGANTWTHWSRTCIRCIVWVQPFRSPLQSRGRPTEAPGCVFYRHPLPQCILPSVVHSKPLEVSSKHWQIGYEIWFQQADTTRDCKVLLSLGPIVVFEGTYKFDQRVLDRSLPTESKYIRLGGARVHNIPHAWFLSAAMFQRMGSAGRA